MRAQPTTFRQLYLAAADYTGDHLHRDVLAPAVDALRSAVDFLRPLRRLAAAPPGLRHDPMVVECFALSIVDDHLIASNQLRSGEREAFFEALGFEPFDERRKFSPIDCEVVAVENDARADDGIELGATHWSGLRFGEMMFARCGKTVRCHSSRGIVGGIAETSMLHFTNHRRHRKVNDLSHGWGSNSRWRTDFHRNYRIGDLTFYNVDGDIDLAVRDAQLHRPDEPPYELALDEARELLVHRGFVKTARFDDHFPYHWCLAVRIADQTWPLAQEDLVPFRLALRQAGVGS